MLRWHNEFPNKAGMYWTQIQEQEHPEILHLVRTEVKFEDGGSASWWTFRRPGLPDFMLPVDPAGTGDLEWAKSLRAMFIDNPNRYWIPCITPPPVPWSDTGVEVQEAGAVNASVNVQKIEQYGPDALAGKLVVVITDTRPLTFTVPGTRQHWLAIFDSEADVMAGMVGINADGMNLHAMPIGDGSSFAEMVRHNQWRVMYNPTVREDGSREFTEIVPVVMPPGHKETPKA